MLPNSNQDYSNSFVGECLSKARKSKKITQEKIAREAGLSKNHISVVERGESKASVALLLIYCKETGLSPNDILGFEDRAICPQLKAAVTFMSSESQKKLADFLTEL